MFNIDNELKQLCKEVYEKTGWQDASVAVDDGNPETPPLYTSDFLSSKLQEFEPKLWYENRTKALNGWWTTIRDDDGLFLSNASTLLKALLKLTIALHKAGEL